MTDKITTAEMVEMFGEEMPIEAINLIWNSPGAMTCGEARAKLREIAANRPTPMTDPLSARLSELNPDDFAGILVRAAEGEELAAGLHRTAIRDGLTDMDDVARWCEKKARAFRQAAALLAERAALNARVEEARGVIEPFADCADQIAAGEDDEEWAKFRLLVKNYRACARWMKGEMK